MISDNGRETARRDEGQDNGRVLTELRELLIGPEQRQLRAMEGRLDARDVNADEVAAVLCDALDNCRSSDATALARALAPVLTESLRHATDEHPRDVAVALAPSVTALQNQRSWLASPLLWAGIAIGAVVASALKFI